MKKRVVDVCHVSTVHDAFDGRIFHKECVSLVNAGYRVALVVTHDKTETVQGVNIIPLSPSRGRAHRFFVKSILASFKALATKARVVHFHDPELMFMGVLLRLLGRKVIFDSHENVGNQIEGKSWLGPKFIRKAVKICYRLIESFCILFFVRVVSVTPEIVEDIAPRKGILLRNYPLISLIEANLLEKETNDAFACVYAGGLTRIRGIKEVCEAVQLLDGNVELWLMGPWESESYRKGCLSGKKNIHDLGVLPIEAVFPSIHQADVGIATLYPQKNYLNSLPVKAFEYMTCGLPIIMSDFPYWRESFSNVALFVDPHNVDEIREKIQWLMDHRDEARKLGEQGRKDVLEKYSWEAESVKLIEMYRALLPLNS